MYRSRAEVENFQTNKEFLYKHIYIYTYIYVKYIDVLSLVLCLNAFVLFFFNINLILTATLYNAFFCCKLF